MRALIPLSMIVLLASCSQPAPKPAPPEQAFEPWTLFESNDPLIVAPKCMALLKRPEIASEPEMQATYTAWRTWYEKSGTSPGIMHQMISLNEGAYSATPVDAVRAGAGFCAKKMSEMSPS